MLKHYEIIFFSQAADSNNILVKFCDWITSVLHEIFDLRNAFVGKIIDVFQNLSISTKVVRKVCGQV